jgi:phage gp36-like protein
VPTFDGAYLKEPSDFRAVADERTLIQGADDLDQPDAADHITSFAALLAELPVPPDANSPYTKIVASINDIIRTEEATAETYLRAGGYSLPVRDAAGNPNPVVVKAAAELVVISLRARRGLIAPEEAAEARRRIVQLLRDIARGVVELDAVLGDGNPGASVYAVSSSDRVFSRSKLGDF